MVDLLGVGAPRADGGWLLHRVCARFRHGEVTLVVSPRTDERLALLDAVTARLVPEEGRVWVGGLPVARDTARRIRALVAEPDLRARPVEHRSLLWNVLVAHRSGYRALHGLLRLPQKSERQAARRALDRVGLAGRATETTRGLGAVDRARLALAGALVQRPNVLVVRELDHALEGPDLEPILTLVRSIARSERAAVLASAASPAVATGFSDRIVALADGLLVFDGPPAAFSGDRIAWSFGTA
jgi:phosphonate transport system ATP-binding protein